MIAVVGRVDDAAGGRSAEPMKKVAAMVRLMLMPQSNAASRSCAEERIALPSCVLADVAPHANIRRTADHDDKDIVYQSNTDRRRS